jgi:glycosyltransferase involved in cell wall biosynthesis
LTCLHTLEIGGSQINAIEIGAAVAKLGHEVIIYGPDGELRQTVADLGLEFLPARPKLARLSPRGAATLTRIARRREVDVIHGYEWGPTMDAAFGPHLALGVPVVTTVLSPTVPDFLPRHLTLIVGTVELAETERRRWSRVHLIEPPVDTDANAPVEDRRAVRARFGLRDDELAVVTVARLAPALKREGILAAVDAMGAIGASHRLRLIVVGDGPSRQEIQDRADKVNADQGAELVTLTGAMFDPRDAYAAADVVLGMGGSALRGMAFAKPLVVQGERGFWELLTPQSLPTFLNQGWYGLGDGSDGAPRLAAILAELARNPARHAELGALGRGVVLERFSLTAAGLRQAEIYAEVAAARPGLPRRAAALVNPAAHYAKFRASTIKRALRGRVTAARSARS